jgi:DNA-binding MarR family transcriptional regulator
MLRAHRFLVSELDRELRASRDLSLDEYDVLLQLRRLGPTTMSELAANLLISRASTTRLVDRLVVRGWIERGDDPHDRRIVRVALTPAGRREHTAAARVHLAGVARLMEAPLAGHDRVGLATALTALVPEE